MCYIILLGSIIIIYQTKCYKNIKKSFVFYSVWSNQFQKQEMRQTTKKSWYFFCQKLIRVHQKLPYLLFNSRAFTEQHQEGASHQNFITRVRINCLPGTLFFHPTLFLIYGLTQAFDAAQWLVRLWKMCNFRTNVPQTRFKLEVMEQVLAPWDDMFSAKQHF